MIFITATSNSIPYLKPQWQMWNQLVTKILKQHHTRIDLEQSFYVGNEAGRAKDKSDDDLLFAQNVDVDFYTPEMMFENKE